MLVNHTLGSFHSHSAGPTWNSSPNMLHVINGTVIIFKTRGLSSHSTGSSSHSHFLTNAASCVLNNFCLPFPYISIIYSQHLVQTNARALSGFQLSCCFLLVFILLSSCWGSHLKYKPSHASSQPIFFNCSLLLPDGIQTPMQIGVRADLL